MASKWTLAFVIGLMMAAAGCGSGHSLAGTIKVIESLPLKQANDIGGDCTGVGGYDDLHAGTAVVVKDETGKVLATGSLAGGKIISLETCQWTFDVANVPDAQFYQVEVSHRGNVTFSRADLDNTGWKVALSLG